MDETRDLLRPRLNRRLTEHVRKFARRKSLREGAAVDFLIASALEREGLWPPPDDPPKERASGPR